LKQLWQRYAERIDAMTLRERVLIFAAVTAVLVALFQTLLLDGEMKKERRLSAAIAQRQAETKALEAQVAKLAASPVQDAERARRERLAEVKRLLAETDNVIATEERKFTAPENMKRVVEEMLARNRGVQLVEMRTLPTTSIAEARTPAGQRPAAKPVTPGERLIYRHGMELTVSGGYLELLRYLEQLEGLPTQLYWSELALNAASYPSHTMKILVYTLSLDPSWLNV
jgi:MSHA biogenesis protein MshJ